MKDFSYGNESRLIFRFAIPILLGNVFQQFYNLVDSVIVGKFIGKEALAAVGTSGPIIFLLVSFIIGITMGFTVVVSQFFGAKQIENVKKTINTLYISMFFTSIFVGVGGVLLSDWIFRIIDLPPQVVPNAKIFLNIFLAGLIFLFGYNSTSAILRGLGDSKTPLYFLIGSVSLNIILDLVFVPLLHWGVWSVALATIISEAVAFIAQILYLNKYHKVIKFSLRDLTFDKDIFYKSMKIGIPTGLQQTFVAAGMVALYWVVNQFGINANAAYSAAGRVDSFLAIPAMSFSIALSAFVGQNLGANRPDRVKKGFHATLLIVSVITVGISIIAVTFSGLLMRMFTNDPVVIAIGREYLVIVGAFYLLFALMFVIVGVLRGAGDTLIPMFISLISLWLIRIPVAYVLSMNTSLGIQGIWWAVPIGWSSGLILYYLYYRKGRWKSKVVVNYPRGTVPVTERSTE
ncbi:MAG: MATE family efflux transporter [Bacteroidales bacterium]|nr:MATE family efflux transporter [Bacteroidales bacterium]MDD4603788.1 MATE family efflux transporter [Bacteroidales bacterium]